MTLLSAVLVSAGALVLVAAAVGSSLTRGPFVRLHYAGLAAMVGAPLLLAGLLVQAPAEGFRLLLIGALVAGTAPVSSSTLARALRRTGHEPGGGT